MKNKQFLCCFGFDLEKVFIALEAGPSAIDACINNIPRTFKGVSEIYLITMVRWSWRPPCCGKILSPSNPPRLGHHLAAWTAVYINLVIIIMIIVLSMIIMIIMITITVMFDTRRGYWACSSIWGGRSNFTGALNPPKRQQSNNHILGRKTTI